VNNRKEFLIKEVEIVQSIISRMASNSFLVKGWAITLIVGILLVDKIDGVDGRISVAFIPLILFWLLDSYFLWQERLYRKLYDWNVTHRLDTNDYLFSLNTERFKKDVSKRTIPFARTFLLFYGAVFASLIIYILSLYFGLIK